MIIISASLCGNETLPPSLPLPPPLPQLGVHFSFLLQLIKCNLSSSNTHAHPATGPPLAACHKAVASCLIYARSEVVFLCLRCPRLPLSLPLPLLQLPLPLLLLMMCMSKRWQSDDNSGHDNPANCRKFNPSIKCNGKRMQAKEEKEREGQRKRKKRRGEEECKVDNNLATLAYLLTLPNSPALSELIVCANWLMSDWCWTDCCAVQLKLKAKEGFKNAKLFKCWLNEVKYLVVWCMCNVCVMYA